MLYFAYASNLFKAQMAVRCRQSVPVRAAVLEGYQLAFVGESVRWDGGGTATIIPKEGASVPGALYELSVTDERSLDRFEGVPTVYDRLEIEIDGEKAYTYIGRSTDFRPPSERYLDTIRKGYRDWGHPEDPLDAIMTLEDCGNSEKSRFADP
ncbi:MAG: gamma-glutamylcyclotransferase [bacterium]|jgi:gamma-glutamylcyclotransferase (GGCT)/AIG2-like uncharacterized protein YtfP